MKNNLFRLTIHLLFCLFFSSASYALVTGTIVVEQFHNTSSAAKCAVAYRIQLSNGWTGYSSVASLVLKNDAGTTVYTHPGGSSTNPEGTIYDLPTGHYLFTANINTRESDNITPASVYIEQHIWVGNKVYWENCFDMENGASQYSIRRSKASSGQAYSYVQSFNTLPTSTAGWAEMAKLNYNMNDSHIFWVLEPLADPRTFSPSDNVTYIEFFYTNSTTSGIRVKYKKAGGTWQTDVLSAVLTDKIRFVRTSGGTCTLQKNSSTSTLFTFPVNITGALKLTVLGKQHGDQADQVSTSYAYPSANYPLSNVFNSGAQTNTGDLTMRIAPYSGYAAPYNYFVSDSPIADMKTVYKYLKDTIYPNEPVDSTTFFGGKVASTTYTNTGLGAGTYYTAAFDSKGVRIFSNVQDVAPTIEFQNKSFIESSNNEYVATGGDAYMNMKIFVTEQENNARMIYYVPNLTEEMVFGFVDQASSIVAGGNTVDNIEYGFRVSSGNLYMIVDGVSIGSITGKANVPIELAFDNGEVLFLSEGTVIGHSPLPSTFSYKSGVYLKKWGTRIRLTGVLTLFSPYRINVTGSEIACDKTTATLGIALSGFLGQSVSNINFTLKNITDDTPVNVTTMTTATLSVPSLPVGVYSLEGSMTTGGINYSNIKRVIYVGSRISWDPYANIVNWPNNNANTHSAIATTSVNAITKGQAISANKLAPQTAGWMVITPSMPSGTPGNPFQPAVSVSFSESPLMGSTAFDYSMPVVHFVSGMVLYSNLVSGQIQAQPVQGFAANTPLLVWRGSTGVVKIRQNYSTLSSVSNYTNARWKPAFLSRRPSAGISNCLASFQCSSYASDIHAQLKYEMDGYYHVMKNGDINFVFDQEYDDANLKFNIYNSNDILIRTQAAFPPVSTTHGMNYKTIVVRGSDCIGQGFFYLEVINSKNEKLYLRFYNDYSGCVPAESPGGEGQ